MLHLCRDLIDLRRGRDDLRGGGYEGIAAPEHVWVFRRGNDTVVAINLSDTATEVELGAGRILLGTERGRDGVSVASPMRLGPWEAIVLAASDG